MRQHHLFNLTKYQELKKKNYLQPQIHENSFLLFSEKLSLNKSLLIQINTDKNSNKNYFLNINIEKKLIEKR